MKHDQAYFLDFLIFSLFSSTTAWLDFLFTFSLDFLTFSLLSSLAFFFSSSILDFLSKMGSSAGFFLISWASSIQGSSEKRHLKKKNTKYKVSLSTWKHLWALFQLLQEFIRGKDHLGNFTHILMFGQTGHGHNHPGKLHRVSIAEGGDIVAVTLGSLLCHNGESVLEIFILKLTLTAENYLV